MGVVYVVVNDLWPDLVKIGYSMRTGHARAHEFQREAGTGCPGHFRCVYQREFRDPQAAEEIVHRALKERRAHKEWFRCSVSEAREVISVVVEEAAADEPAVEFKAPIERPLLAVERSQVNVANHLSTTSSGSSQRPAAGMLVAVPSWVLLALVLGHSLFR